VPEGAAGHGARTVRRQRAVARRRRVLRRVERPVDLVRSSDPVIRSRLSPPASRRPASDGAGADRATRPVPTPRRPDGAPRSAPAVRGAGSRSAPAGRRSRPRHRARRAWRFRRGPRARSRPTRGRCAAGRADRGPRCPAGRCRVADASRARRCARPRTGCWRRGRPRGRDARGDSEARAVGCLDTRLRKASGVAVGVAAMAARTARSSLRRPSCHASREAAALTIRRSQRAPAWRPRAPGRARGARAAGRGGRDDSADSPSWSRGPMTNRSTEAPNRASSSARPPYPACGSTSPSAASRRRAAAMRWSISCRASNGSCAGRGCTASNPESFACRSAASRRAASSACSLASEPSYPTPIVSRRGVRPA
jgi:hypothetical protein